MGQNGTYGDAATDLPTARSLRSDLIKVEAEKAEPESGEASKAACDPENAACLREVPETPSYPT